MDDENSLLSVASRQRADIANELRELRAEVARVNDALKFISGLVTALFVYFVVKLW